MQDMDEQGEQEVIFFGQQQTSNETFERAYPWYSEDTQKLLDPILRMHNETIQFYQYISPNSDKEHHEANQVLYDRIRDVALEQLGDVMVVSPFFKNELYLKGTQAEICLLVEKLNKEKSNRFSERLGQKLGASCSQLENQQKYQIFQWEVEHGSSKAIIRMLQREHWQQYFTLMEESIQNIIELKYLYMILSCMIRQRWMHLSIRPFLLFGLLSVFYHERRKQRHRTLSENIIKFVEYYGVGPFQQRRINYLGKGMYQLVQEGQGQTPFSFWINGKFNIGVQLLKDFFALLKNRYRLISNYNYDEEQSIIGSLVNPCQKLFEYI